MNKSEQIVRESVEEAGGLALHEGAPDFFCYNNGRFCYIEVKMGKQKLQRHQNAFISLLVKLGIQVFVVQVDRFGNPSRSLTEAIAYLCGDDSAEGYSEFDLSVKADYEYNARKTRKKRTRSVKRGQIVKRIRI